MVKRDKYEANDTTPFDQSKLQDLQTIKHTLLHAMYGKDVRPGIAQLPDALIKALQDSTNLGELGALTELVEARGGYETLGLHETAQDNGIQNAKASAVNANQKGDNAINLARASASGSPKGVFANVDELKNKYPNGASGIYVTRNNGHWWFYDYEHGKWTDGGAYQATEIADRTVTLDKLANDVKTNGMDIAGGSIALNWSVGYVANSAKEKLDGTKEGTILTNPDFSLTQNILVHSGDLIVVHGNTGTIASLVSYWDLNGNYISSLKDGISLEETVSVTIPGNGYIRISAYNPNISLDNVTVEKRPVFSPLSLSGRTAGAIDWTNLLVRWEEPTFIGSPNASNDKFKNKIVHNSTVDKRFLTSTAFGLQAGTIITIKAGISSNANLLSEFSSDGNTLMGSLIVGNGKSNVYHYYIDHNCYLRISNDTNIEPNPTIATKHTASQLAGKKINMLGDSYVKNDIDSVENAWHYKLADKYGMTYRNYGVNGNGMVSPSATGTPMVERFGEMNDDADFIVVIGGKNDYNQQVSIDDFKKGVDELITGLVAKYPAGKIVFFTPWSTGANDSKGIRLSDYAQAIQDECELYGVPCFNSNKQSGMYPWDTTFRAKYYQSKTDVSHLNSAGHDRFLPRAEAFLNSL